jgi:DNA-binding IclR family transcriptional regulator
VRGPGGEVVAALSVTGPSFRLDDVAVAAAARALVAAAERVSRELGAG